jgi:N-acetylmuramoyl-L-alanine amidase
MAPLVKRLNDLNIESEELVIIIDAGHGGKDAGSTEGAIEEKSITMSYANALKKALAKHNVKVITTRSGDEWLSLKERTEISKNHKEALFISIHVNQAKSDGAKGFEIFIPESNHAEFLKSQKFARSIEYQMQDGEMASRGIKSANYWILTHTECPVVLVELGFMSSEIDRALLTSEEYEETWARKMASSIYVYAR